MFERQATILSSWYGAGIGASNKTRISFVAKRALEEKFYHLTEVQRVSFVGSTNEDCYPPPV